MITKQQRAATRRYLESLTGKRWCPVCSKFRPIEGGHEYWSIGRRLWRCALCHAARAAR